MEEMYKQVQEYLNMDDEIPFKEFRTYYQNVISHFDENAEQFSEDELWKGLFVAESIMSNAENRAKEERNSSQAKKYRKMADRTTMYAQYFTKQINQLGYGEEAIRERFEAMLEEGSKKEDS